MRAVTAGSLFSGIGGLDLAVEAVTGARTVWQVERDAWCRSVLARHWPEARRFDDVRTVGKELERVDIIAGGFPCQDLSHAGKRAGLAGERSGLWREFARIIRVVGPRFVFVENVSGLLSDSGAMGAVLGDLAAMGYAAEWGVFRAGDVGAPHRRERVFILAVADGDAHGQPQPQGRITDKSGRPFDGSEGMADDQSLRRGARGLSVGESAARADTRVRSECVGDAGAVGATQRRGSTARGPQAGDAGRAVSVGDAHDARGEGADAGRLRAGKRAAVAASPVAHADGSTAQRDESLGLSERSGAPQPRTRGDAWVGVGQADPNCEHREERDGAAERSGTQHAVGGSRSGRDGIGAVESRVGRDVDGLPARLAGHRWPAGRGEAQHEWEPPRVAEGVVGRARQLRALGNAVVPQQAALALTVLAERLGVASVMGAA